MKSRLMLKTGVIVLALSAAVVIPRLNYAAGQEGTTETLKGEIVDLMCYLDHGAMGEKHKGCATKCIKGGGPVGLLVGDQVYLVVGDHQPMNEELAPKAAETVTLKGKVVGRSGMKMIENAVLVP